VKEARAGTATEHGRADYENPPKRDATLQLSSIVEAIIFMGTGLRSRCSSLTSPSADGEGAVSDVSVGVRKRYLAAIGVSLLVHGSLIALLPLVTTRHALSESGEELGKMTTVAVVEVPPEDPVPEFERKDDEGVVAPELVAGFTFDVDKIGRRRSRLFPLI
jgi:hypothetical protein